MIPQKTGSTHLYPELKKKQNCNGQQSVMILTADQKNVKSSRKKACILPLTPTSKRKLCLQDFSDLEDPFTNLDVNAF